jgi:hypothetical protein
MLQAAAAALLEVPAQGRDTLGTGFQDFFQAGDIVGPLAFAPHGPHPLAVRTENVVAVGDATFFEGANYRVADNDRLVSNLVSFLVSGDRTRGVVATTEGERCSRA